MLQESQRSPILRKNCTKKNIKIFIEWGLYLFALLKSKRTISENALERPVLGVFFPKISSEFEGIG